MHLDTVRERETYEVFRREIQTDMGSVKVTYDAELGDIVARFDHEREINLIMSATDRESVYSSLTRWTHSQHGAIPFF